MGVFDFFKSKEYHITTDKLDEEQLSTHRESSGLTMSESALSERGLLLAKHLDEKAQTDSPKKGLTPEQLKKVVEILKMRLKGKGIVPKTSKPMQEKEYTCPIFNAKFVLIPAGTNDENELGDYAWYDDNSERKTHPVGQKKPNGLGLYDMSGNVWEWCSDWYGEEYCCECLQDNPRGPSCGTKRVWRGGCWFHRAQNTRAAARGSDEPDWEIGQSGFRLAISPR